jgi:hypothetical protein
MEPAADSCGAEPMMPLLAEVELISLASFALGLLLAYMFEVRRRNRRM